MSYSCRGGSSIDQGHIPDRDEWFGAMEDGVASQGERDCAFRNIWNVTAVCRTGVVEVAERAFVPRVAPCFTTGCFIRDGEVPIWSQRGRFARWYRDRAFSPCTRAFRKVVGSTVGQINGTVQGDFVNRSI